MRLFHVLATTMFFISDSVGADRLPKNIPNNKMFAQMDGKIYKSKGMRTYEQWRYPSWLQQAHMFESITADFVYLRPESGLAYAATLQIDRSEASGSSSHSPSRIPESIRVHLVHEGHHTYYRADKFQLQPIPSNQRRDYADGDFPVKNYIYIARKTGPVFSAPMIDYTPYIGPHHIGRDRPDIPDADGLPVLIPNNNIYVFMDRKIYKTKQINMRYWYDGPFWLQQGQFFHLIEYDSIYIRLRVDCTYDATLFSRDHSNSSEARTHHSTPKSVRVHIVREGHHTFFKSGVFESFPVPHKEEVEDPDRDYPPGGYIYVARKGGPVYRARLIEFTAPQGQISSDEALHLAIYV